MEVSDQVHVSCTTVLIKIDEIQYISTLFLYLSCKIHYERGLTFNNSQVMTYTIHMKQIFLKEKSI